MPMAVSDALQRGGFYQSAAENLDGNDPEEDEEKVRLVCLREEYKVGQRASAERRRAKKARLAQQQTAAAPDAATLRGADPLGR